MSRLFVSCYLDEDVSAIIGKLLQSRTFVVETTHGAGRCGCSDQEQLAHAAEQQMAIVTHNRRDFEQLAAEYREAQRSHAGIIIAVRRTPHEIASRLLQLLNQVSAEEMDNQVYYI